MQIRSKFVVSVVSLLGVIACGDDDGGGGGGGGGVSGNKKVGDLSAAEAKSLCKSLQSKFDGLSESTTDFVCTTQGALLSGGDADRCETMVTDCKKDPDTVIEELDCDSADSDTGLSDQCDEVTVAELNACIDAQAKVMKDLAGKVSCTTSLADLGELSGDIATPQACADIEDKCPDVAVMPDAP